MKRLLIFLLWLPSVGHATTYYVSNAGNSGNNGTTTGTTWTIAKFRTEVNAGTIAPGDFIFFKKGDVYTSASQFGFSGSPNSGTALNPITLSSYGTGAKPRWEVSTTSGAFNIIGLNYWIFDGLDFTDQTFSTTDKISTAPMNCGIRLGDFSPGGTTSNHNIIRNCPVGNTGLGYVINGDFNLIENCDMTNLKNVFNTPGGDNDYGANGITIKGNDNIIQDCLIQGAWCASYDYGYSGGAIEFFGACNRNKFLRLTLIDCGAVGEFGADDPSTTSEHNTIAYSLILNCGALSYVNFQSNFTTTATNTEYWNCVIVENNFSRFSGTNNGTGITGDYYDAWLAGTSATGETAMLSFGSNSPADTVYDVRNCVFVLPNNQKVAYSSTVAGKTIHLNNLYRFSGGSSAGYTTGISEVATSAQIFQTEGGDPATWDFHLKSGSVAKSVGQVISSLSLDYYKVSTAGKPINAGVSVTNPDPASDPAPGNFILTRHRFKN